MSREWIDDIKEWCLVDILSNMTQVRSEWRPILLNNWTQQLQAHEMKNIRPMSNISTFV